MVRARRLRDAVRHLVVAHGSLEEARRPCGAEMSLPHAYALLELLHAAEPMTVSELATRLSIDRTNVSRLCARMDAAGELSRREHPDDARARLLGLTARGRRVAKSVDESSARHFARLERHLGGDAGRVIETLELLRAAMLSARDDGEEA